MSVIEKSGEFAIEAFLIRRWEVSHDLNVSQKLRASTSKKQSLYRMALSNIQIVVYKVNYCLGIFPSKVFQHGTMVSSFIERLSHMESGSRSSACCPIRRDGTVVSLSEDGLCRRGTRRDCKGDMGTWNILQIFSKTAQQGVYMLFEVYSRSKNRPNVLLFWEDWLGINQINYLIIWK